MIKSHNRKRVDDMLSAQDDFNRESDRLIADLRAGVITIAEYESAIALASDELEQQRAKLTR